MILRNFLYFFILFVIPTAYNKKVGRQTVCVLSLGFMEGLNTIYLGTVIYWTYHCTRLKLFHCQIDERVLVCLHTGGTLARFC